MALENEIQSDFYTILTGLGYTVYDEPPALPDGMPEQDFPYIVIGDFTAVPFDTDDSIGARVTCTLHVWTRYKGHKQVKDMLAGIYGALHRAELTLAGYDAIDCLWEFSEVIRDSEYRHGVCRYVVTAMET